MSSGRKPPRPVTPLRALLWLGALAAFLLGIDLLQRFASYKVLERDRRSLVRTARRPVKDSLLWVAHGLDRGPSTEGLPVFDFHFRAEDRALLDDHLRRVQLIGTHDDQTRSWVEGRMTVEGETYDVRVKLRGRQYYHVVPPRPSLRVSLRRGRTYRGAKTFNLVEPFDKTADQVFLWESEEQGLVGWDQTLAVIAFGGTPVGLCQYVEQVRRETGDRYRRPEGVFFRGEASDGDGENIYAEGSDPERCLPVVKRVMDWLADTEKTVPFEEMREAMDLGRLRWFTALTELSGDSHGLAPFNMKGFCDPVSLKVEFLIWDTRFGDWASLPESQFPTEGTQFLRCDRYRALHDETLYRLVEERVEPMLASFQDFHEEHGERFSEDALYWFLRGGPDGGFMKDRRAKFERILRKNAADIRAALTGENLEWFLDASAREISLRTEDRGSKVVTHLVLSSRPGPVPLERPATVYGRYREHQPVVVLPLPSGVEASEVVGVVAHRLHGGAAVAPVRSEAALEGTRTPLPEERLPSLPLLPKGFQVDAAAGSIVVGPGKVALENSLSLPLGWSVELRPGTILEMGPAVLLEVRGDFAARGTPSEPIEVRRSGEEPWGAVTAVGEPGAPIRVELSHFLLRDGGGSDAGRVRYTGSLAIYYADATLERVTIEGARSEDAINLKQCTFRTTDCVYRGGASDAVDYDFCKGTDVRTLVEDFKNDGIDMSGSEIRLDAPVVRRVGDKGLSLGEASRPEVLGARVSEARAGCAVKDGTDAVIEDLTVTRSRSAVELYVKKPGFEPPHATFRRLVAVDVEGLAVVDHRAEATFEDAVRVGGPERPMRPFAGTRNEVREGLSGLRPDALLSLAEEIRSARPR
ncbi:MAG: hypothetical protein L0323_01480 [Planctomycetes bacterium]|nr:hypothetical protein [Planctomycetota bacterium]